MNRRRLVGVSLAAMAILVSAYSRGAGQNAVAQQVSSSIAGGTWTQVPSLPNALFSSSAITGLDGKIYVFGATQDGKGVTKGHKRTARVSVTETLGSSSLKATKSYSIR